MDDVLTYVETLCQNAMTALQEGDGGALLNQVIGANQALAHYNANVFMRKSIPPESWRLYYPQFYAEVKRIKEADEAGTTAKQQAADLTQRVSSLEEKLTLVLDRMEKFMEAQQTAPVAEATQVTITMDDHEIVTTKPRKAGKKQQPEPESPAADPDAEEPDDQPADEA